MRAGFPRHRSCARPCRSRAPALDLFVIRRSQTTEVETHIVTLAIAGDRPPRYGKKRHFRALRRSRGTGPRATVKKLHSLTVGRGPVPRHAPVYQKLAGETLSDARVASEGPRATVKKTPPLTVGRGPVPRHRSCARPCRSRAPALDPFVIRRSQTTEKENTS